MQFNDEIGQLSFNRYDTRKLMNIAGGSVPITQHQGHREQSADNYWAAAMLRFSLGSGGSSHLSAGHFDILDCPPVPQPIY